MSTTAAPTTAPTTTTIYVLLYGKEMSSARFDVWRQRAEKLSCKSYNRNNKDDDDDDDDAVPPLRLVPVTNASHLTSSLSLPRRRQDEESSSARRRRNVADDVLVVHRKFSSSSSSSAAHAGPSSHVDSIHDEHDSGGRVSHPPPPVPSVVRDAVGAALRRSMIIATESWLTRYLDEVASATACTGGARQRGERPRFALGDDVTDWYRKRLEIVVSEDETMKRADDDDEQEREQLLRRNAAVKEEGAQETSLSSRTCSGPPVIDLLDDSSSDGDGDDDEVVVLERPPLVGVESLRRSKREASDVVRTKAPADVAASDAAERPSRKRRRSARGDAPWSHRSSSSTSNHELKAGKAHAAQTRDVAGLRRMMKQNVDATATPLAPEAFLAASPECQVYDRASTFMRRRKERGQTWMYAFEKCHERYMNETQKKAALRSAVGGDSSSSSAPTTRSTVEEGVEHHYGAIIGEIQKRNRSIADRLRRLVSAEAVMDELSSTTDVGMHGGSSTGSKSSQLYRERQYERVAREVESYPLPVTLDCLELPSDVRKETVTKYGIGIFSSSVSLDPPKWIDTNDLRKIKCGGSVARRVIRAIAMMDVAAGPLLKWDEAHACDEEMLKNPEVSATQELRKIWGVGVSKALKLVGRGIYTISQLRADDDAMCELTEQQRVGVERYEDLQERIPRSEVTEIWKYVSGFVATLSNDQVTAIAGGSYRRGAQSSGDVDFILLPKQGEVNCGEETSPPDGAAMFVMEELLQKLRSIGFITDDLAVPDQFKDNKKRKDLGAESVSYMGVCRLQDRADRKHRHIDIKAYPGCQGPFALLYFTGDTHFNRSMRLFAKKAGMTLSDAGLSCCNREKIGQRWEKTKIYDSACCGTEEEVFEVLGIGYVPPTWRRCLEFANTNGENAKRWDLYAGYDSDDDGTLSD